MSNVQQTLNNISNYLIDPKVWRIVALDEDGRVVASTTSIIQMEVIATLLSTQYPKITVKIMKHNLVRRAYRNGRVLSEEEHPNLINLLPKATLDEERSWASIL